MPRIPVVNTMADVLQRLHNRAGGVDQFYGSVDEELDRAAIGEIERLRRVLERMRLDLRGIFPRSQAGSIYKQRTDDVIKRIDAALNIQQRAEK